MSASSSFPTKLLSLQACRGLAALAVVFYHTALFLRDPARAGYETFGPVTELGVLGVNFFFILSGFIILMAHIKNLGRPRDGLTYLRRRIVRIYPLYWVCLTAYVVAAFFGVMKNPSFSWEWDQFISPAVLFYVVKPLSEDPLPVKVAWTLFYEMQFYLFFLLVILNKKAGLAAFAAWFCSIILLRYTGAVSQASPLFTAHTTFFSAWNLHFLFGMLAYLAYRRLSPRYWPWFMGAGASLLGYFIFRRVTDASGASIHVLQNDLLPLLAVAFGCLVLGLVMAERRGVFKASATLTFLGDASYSLYLFHSAFLSVGVPLLNKYKVIDAVGPKPAFFLLSLFATAGGCACYLLIERPLMKALSFGKKTKKAS